MEVTDWSDWWQMENLASSHTISKEHSIVSTIQQEIVNTFGKRWTSIHRHKEVGKLNILEREAWKFNLVQAALIMCSRLIKGSLSARKRKYPKNTSWIYFRVYFVSQFPVSFHALTKLILNLGIGEGSFSFNNSVSSTFHSFLVFIEPLLSVH